MTFGIFLITFGLGILLLLFGTRIWLLGAGAGALLGIGLLRLLPGEGIGILGFMIVVGLAVAVGLAAFFFKAFSKLIVFGIGFIAGGAITLAVLDIFSFGSILWIWILALVGALIGGVLANRFFEWTIILFAAIVGALLIVRGLEIWLGDPFTNSILASIIALVLAGMGIFYLARKR